MGLSCWCDDFDKGEHDNWWEGGFARVPPEGSKCCECGAPLPNEECTCFFHYEVWDGPDTMPIKPWEAEKDESISDEDYAVIKKTWNDWAEKHGWDEEFERFERISDVDYRCDRCAGLAEAYESLGYCMIGPREVIEANIDYAWEHSHIQLKWAPDKDGVLQPHHWTRLDHLQHKVRIYRSRLRMFFLYGGWHYMLRRRIWWPIKRFINRIRRNK